MPIARAATTTIAIRETLLWSITSDLARVKGAFFEDISGIIGDRRFSPTSDVCRRRISLIMEMGDSNTEPRAWDNRYARPFSGKKGTE